MVAVVLRPHEINQVVIFQQRAQISDADGNTQAGPWQFFAECAVKAKMEFARERVQQGRLHAKYSGSLHTWRTPELEGVTEDMRVKFIDGHLKGKYAAIRGVLFENPGELAFVVEEGEEP